MFLFDVMISGSRLRGLKSGMCLYRWVLRVGCVCIGGYWEFGHDCYLVVGICVVIWGYSGRVE